MLALPTPKTVVGITAFILAAITNREVFWRWASQDGFRAKDKRV
jgi:hypothetical protein